MKHIFTFLHFFFRPGLSGLIIILLLLFSAITIAQESTPEEFPIGSTMSGQTFYNWDYYNSFDTSGMNTIFQYADDATQSRLENYNLVATNGDIGDWISYYSTCYYSRWESEEDLTGQVRVGVKHEYGDTATWNGVKCWSSIGVDSAVDSLVYGPHYRQDNRYKNWVHDPDRHNVRYFVRFNVALDNPYFVNPELEVCRIKVVYRYTVEHNPPLPPPYDIRDTTFLERTLTVGDFPDSGKFNYFTFDPPNNYYKYPEQFWLPKDAGKTPFHSDETIWYNDSNGDNGIQFCVDWLVTNPEELELTLFVDHFEVYDRDWGIHYIQNPSLITERITDYLVDYPTSEWSNLSYWAGHDEPWSIDAFAPTRIVDEILQSANASRLLTTFQPYWSYDGKINGETLINQFVEMANPQRLIVDPYPFYPNYPVIRFDELEWLRSLFQQCHTLRSGFWYMGQGFGHELDSGGWITWRRPTPSELKATSMLALAHGSRGLMYWNYDSYHWDNYTIQALITLNKQPTDLWFMIRNELAPRLKGTLGITLLDLDYIGDYINVIRNQGENPLPDQIWRYFRLHDYGPDYF